MFDYFESSAKTSSITFSTRKVASHSLERIFKAACTHTSPRSASWLKCVTKQEMLDGLAIAAHGNPAVRDAPVVLVYFDGTPIDNKHADALKLTQINDHEASHNFTSMAVVAAGLASTLITAFDTEVVQDCLGTPKTLRPRSMLCLGYTHN